MDSKRLLTATALCGFGMWVVAGVWHNLVLASFYEQVHAEHEGIGILLLSYFILALLMSYLYTMIYQGEKPIMNGLKIGVLVGILWVFPHELAMAGAHGDSLAYVFKNGGWHVVEQGIGGWIIGMVFRKMK